LFIFKIFKKKIVAYMRPEGVIIMVCFVLFC
jgi:hypothetical protein